MSALQAEVFEAFRAIDVPEGKALRAATALTSAFDKVQDETVRGFDKRDADIEAIRDDVAALRSALVAHRAEAATTTELASVKTEVQAVRSDLVAHRAESATKAELVSVKTEVQALKVDMAVVKWMLGFLLALNAAILFKLIAH